MNKLLLSLLAILLLIEEWLWDLLTALGRSLSHWLHLEQAEEWLRQTKPTIALIAFTIPLMIVAPLNLIAFALIANGLILQGILTEILAKLLGTLLVARVFALTKPQLLTFSFINSIYTTITSWLKWAHDKITESAVYRIVKQLKAQFKEYRLKKSNKHL